MFYLFRQHGEKLLLGDQSDGLVDHLTVLEEDENGQAHHTVFFGNVLCVIHVDLADLDVRTLCGNLLQDRGKHTAGRTPRRPEINNDDPICMQHLGVKCFTCQFNNSHVLNLLHQI